MEQEAAVVGESLRRIVLRVLERNRSELEATTSWVAFADANGLVSVEWSSDPRIEREMRAIALGAGAELDTDAAGRNGIGTALRLGTSSFVRGADHDDERFFDLVCAASPVLHPVNSSVCGVINVTGHLKASHSHVALALKLIVSQIRGELVRATPPRPLRLADAHRRLTAHMPNAVATFDENTLIAEDALTPQLATVNRRELWESLSTLSVTAKEMVLPTGHRVRVVPVTKGTWSHGASAVFDIPRANAVDAVRHDGDGGPLTLLEEAERSVIASVLRQYDGNKSDAAERLGLSRGTLYARIRRYRL